jgi:hypothetical protein
MTVSSVAHRDHDLLVFEVALSWLRLGLRERR